MNADEPFDSAGTGSLFGDQAPAQAGVGAAVPDESLERLAAELPAQLHLGTSSWHFPGWANRVWDRLYSEKQLSRAGLSAYARHPLFGAVSLDRAFYRPLSVAQYAAYADQVPEGFRFLVKAPARVTDALIRESGGQGVRDNPDFLDADLAWHEFAAPASEGLGEKLGALVFQISPLPGRVLADLDGLIARLHEVLRSAQRVKTRLPAAVVAVEVRNPQWLAPAFVDALKDSGATYCLGLHPKMPAPAEQLPILRQLWPGPFVCRWNLNPRHGAYGYEAARESYAPFDQMVDPDLHTREIVARVAAGTARQDQPVYVTINNKAEGCAPESVRALAEAIQAMARSRDRS
ncbi:DUF72 domain-containing protein [Salinisphaera sp.]|uniref:DUF72 domain-containing protein n=1 Tax=Salinisphaera sp. TaxID=1914330 RepID=UPI000C61FAB6|nr:DUF72 domain-containing protein [Salinisphaera sp.]MBS63707.1 hypothetical protein [Salinisphaera sp.]